MNAHIKDNELVLIVRTEFEIEKFKQGRHYIYPSEQAKVIKVNIDYLYDNSKKAQVLSLVQKILQI